MYDVVLEHRTYVGRNYVDPTPVLAVLHQLAIYQIEPDLLASTRQPGAKVCGQCIEEAPRPRASYLPHPRIDWVSEESVKTVR